MNASNGNEILPDSSDIPPARSGFSRWLKRYLRQRSWSQVKLLKNINTALDNWKEPRIDQSTLSKVVSGKRKGAPERMVRAIAHTAGVPVGDLMMMLEADDLASGEADASAKRAGQFSQLGQETVSIVAGFYLLAAPAILAKILETAPSIADRSDTSFRTVSLRVATTGSRIGGPRYWEGPRFGNYEKGADYLTALDAVSFLTPLVPGHADLALIPGELLSDPKMADSPLLPVAELVSSSFACYLIAPKSWKERIWSAAADGRVDKTGCESNGVNCLTTDQLGGVIVGEHGKESATLSVGFEKGTFTERVFQAALDAVVNSQMLGVSAALEKAKDLSVEKMIKAIDLLGNPDDEDPESINRGLLTWDPYSSMAATKHIRCAIYFSPDKNGYQRHHSYVVVTHGKSLAQPSGLLVAFLRRIYMALNQLHVSIEYINRVCRGWNKQCATIEDISLLRPLSEYFTVRGDGSQQRDSPDPIDAIDTLVGGLRPIRFEIRPTMQFAELFIKALL